MLLQAWNTARLYLSSYIATLRKILIACVFISALLTTVRFLALLCKHKGARAPRALVN